MAYSALALFCLFVLVANASTVTTATVALKNQLHNGKTIFLIPKGTSVSLLANYGDYSKIRIRNFTGFVLSRYLSSKTLSETRLASTTNLHDLAIIANQAKKPDVFVSNTTNPSTLYTTATDVARGEAVLKDVEAGVKYARKHYNNPNHDCTKRYNENTPYGYYGSTACNITKTAGGDAANFVSQILIAAGHPVLTKGECRGKYFGGAEVGSARLRSCLVKNYGWSSAGVSYHCKAPKNVAVGDLIAFYSKKTDLAKYIAFVNRVSNGMAYITSHSQDLYDRKYNYIFRYYPYCEFLLRKL